MESISSSTQTPLPVRKKGRFKRFALRGLLVIVAAAVVAHFAWKYSGSNEWQALPEQDGIRAYSMKSPGSTLVKYKGVGRIHASLSSITRFMQDPTTCDDVGCYEPVVLEMVSPKIQYMSFIYNYGPFTARQFVVKVDVSQDPTTKEVLVQYVGDPDRIAPNDCCVRVPHMNNSWRFRPLENGELEVEYLVDMYEGGSIPYFFANTIHHKAAYRGLRKISKIVVGDKFKEKFRDVKLDFIQEANAG